MSAHVYSEYDTFGPWVYEIDDNHKLSPLFMPYKGRLSDAVMAFKIPRNIERRKANPNMHLYNEVVALFKTHILVLKRKHNNVIEQKIPIKDIYSIEKKHFLLKGDLYLYTNDSTINISYNTISGDVIVRFVSLLRQQQESCYKKLPLASLDYDAKKLDYLYIHLIDELVKVEDDIELVAYQPEFDLKPNIKTKNKEKRKRRRRLLPCTVFVSNNRELIIINRDKLIRKGDNYQYSHIYLPFSNIDNVLISDYPKKENIKLLSFRTGIHKFIFSFNKKNIGIEELVKVFK